MRCRWTQWAVCVVQNWQKKSFIFDDQRPWFPTVFSRLFPVNKCFKSGTCLGMPQHPETFQRDWERGGTAGLVGKLDKTRLISWGTVDLPPRFFVYFAVNALDLFWSIVQKSKLDHVWFQWKTIFPVLSKTRLSLNAAWKMPRRQPSNSGRVWRLRYVRQHR